MCQEDPSSQEEAATRSTGCLARGDTWSETDRNFIQVLQTAAPTEVSRIRSELEEPRNSFGPESLAGRYRKADARSRAPQPIRN